MVGAGPPPEPCRCRDTITGHDLGCPYAVARRAQWVPNSPALPSAGVRLDLWESAFLQGLLLSMMKRSSPPPFPVRALYAKLVAASEAMGVSAAGESW